MSIGTAFETAGTRMMGVAGKAYEAARKHAHGTVRTGRYGPLLEHASETSIMFKYAGAGACALVVTPLGRAVNAMGRGLQKLER